MVDSRQVKGIVFDMDGVMFDTERLAIDGWLHAGKEGGFEITEEMLISTIGVDAKTSLQIFYSHLGEHFDFWGMRSYKTHYVEEQIKEHGFPVKPGLHELLQYLSENDYAVAVASSTETEKVKENLEIAGVARYFRHVVGGDLVERGKPEPDIYLAACERIHLPPEECVAIEDSPAGIRSAHSAGLRVIMIPDLVAPGKHIENVPYTLLKSLSEVPGYLETI